MTPERCAEFIGACAPQSHRMPHDCFRFREELGLMIVEAGLLSATARRSIDDWYASLMRDHGTN